MLDLKLKRAAQAILKNNALLVCSGSGMAADCTLQGERPCLEGTRIPTFRGTYGLWKQYPAFRNQMILFDDLVEQSFFR